MMGPFDEKEEALKDEISYISEKLARAGGKGALNTSGYAKYEGREGAAWI